MQRLTLIDGSGFIFRAYHAIQAPMTRSDGLPVKAVYGFVNMMLKLMEGQKSDHIAVIFDAGRQTFRNRLYSEYKAHRPPPPDDLLPQFPLVRRATEALGIPAIEMEDYEADDLIATYTRVAREAGMEVVIVSSDKDLMQLIEDGHVAMYDGMKQKTLGRDYVFEKFGVGPERVRDVLALIGDTSDNIPGVPGIGPKTAAELITQFGTLENILGRAGDIPQKARRESLVTHAEKARLSYELIGLCDTVPLPLPLSALAAKAPQSEILIGFLREMEFKTLTARMEEKLGVAPLPPAVTSAAKVTQRYALISNEAALAHWVEKAKHGGRFAVMSIGDTEDAPLGLALCAAPGEGHYVPFSQGNNADAPPQHLLFAEPAIALRPREGMSAEHIFGSLAPLFADPALLKIGHNVKTVLRMLAAKGISALPVDDTMLLSYVLDTGKRSHELEEVALRHLEMTLTPLDSVTGTGRARVTLEAKTPAELLDYAAARADAVFRLNDALKPLLVAHKTVALYETIERPLVPVIARMEAHGIKVDPQQLAALSGDFGQRMQEHEREIYALAGEEFNIGSPKQLGEILFGKLGLAGGKKNSKTGSYATGADILEELAEEGHPLPARILQWRQLSKLKNTYTDALAEEIDPATGRVHTSYALAATSTGRLSSSHPNLQNIPIRTEEGRKIRHAFVADKGNRLISADYSQIELRLLADMADIPSLKQAFREGADIHAITASQMFGVAPDAVNGDLRRKAKTINFGIIYGISAHGLAVRLGISRVEAAAYIETYFQQYPGIQTYMERTKSFAREHGYVLTLFGRKCHIAGIMDRNPSMRSFSERAAINAPLQGTAADIIKRAMIAASHAFRDDARMLLQVHDELVLEASEETAAAIALKLKQVMENAAHLSVPLTVETSIAAHWGKG